MGMGIGMEKEDCLYWVEDHLTQQARTRMYCMAYAFWKVSKS